jgi:hypothetical protein
MEDQEFVKSVDQGAIAKIESENIPAVRQAAMMTDDIGSLALVSLEDQLKFANRLIQEKMISETFKTAQQVVIGIQYCKALNLPALVGLKMMYVVSGKPSLYAEGPLALVQRSSVFDKIREYFIDEDCKEICPENKNIVGAKYFGAVTEVWRKGDAEPQIDFFTIEDLERAGLDFNSYGKKKDTWAKWERIMLRYKARTLALRSKFADVIAGVPVAEYDYSFSPETPDINPEVVNKISVADELNAEFLDKSNEATM